MHASTVQALHHTSDRNVFGKYWICKRAPNHAHEAMGCLGGVGYVEENIMPRVYREAPVNAIWEACRFELWNTADGREL